MYSSTDHFSSSLSDSTAWSQLLQIYLLWYWLCACVPKLSANTWLHHRGGTVRRMGRAEGGSGQKRGGSERTLPLFFCCTRIWMHKMVLDQGAQNRLTSKCLVSSLTFNHCAQPLRHDRQKGPESFVSWGILKMYRSGISGFFDVSLFPPNVNSSPVLEATELQHNTVTVVPLTEHLLCARYHTKVSLVPFIQGITWGG